MVEVPKPQRCHSGSASAACMARSALGAFLAYHSNPGGSSDAGIAHDLPCGFRHPVGAFKLAAFGSLGMLAGLRAPTRAARNFRGTGGVALEVA